MVGDNEMFISIFLFTIVLHASLFGMQQPLGITQLVKEISTCANLNQKIVLYNQATQGLDQKAKLETDIALRRVLLKQLKLSDPFGDCVVLNNINKLPKIENKPSHIGTKVIKNEREISCYQEPNKDVYKISEDLNNLKYLYGTPRQERIVLINNVINQLAQLKAKQSNYFSSYYTVKIDEKEYEINQADIENGNVLINKDNTKFCIINDKKINFFDIKNGSLSHQKEKIFDYLSNIQGRWDKEVFNFCSYEDEDLFGRTLIVTYYRYCNNKIEKSKELLPKDFYTKRDVDYIRAQHFKIDPVSASIDVLTCGQLPGYCSYCYSCLYNKKEDRLITFYDSRINIPFYFSTQGFRISSSSENFFEVCFDKTRWDVDGGKYLAALLWYPSIQELLALLIIEKNILNNKKIEANDYENISPVVSLLTTNEQFIENCTLNAQIQQRSILNQIKDVLTSTDLYALKKRCKELNKPYNDRDNYDKNECYINHYILRRKIFIWAMLWALGSYALINWTIGKLIFWHPVIIIPLIVDRNPERLRAILPFTLFYLCLISFIGAVNYFN